MSMLSEIDEEKLSSMMRHYVNVKKQYIDTIIFYRLGDFYELFFDDAVLMSKELELTLTVRDCGLDKKAPMCGVPCKAVDVYIQKAIEKGYKVAICEQLTEPKPGEIVKRDVVRIVTPGTIMESEILQEKSNNYIASIYRNELNFGVSWIDISTGEFYVTEFADNENLQTLNDTLIMIEPIVKLLA